MKGRCYERSLDKLGMTGLVLGMTGLVLLMTRRVLGIYHAVILSGVERSYTSFPSITETDPSGIDTLNKSVLFETIPPFQLLFSLDSLSGIISRLIVHQLVDVILTRESICNMILMFIKPTL